MCNQWQLLLYEHVKNLEVFMLLKYDYNK